MEDKPQIYKHFEALSDMYQEKIKQGKCPNCDYELINQSGCNICMSCGWSACG